MRIWDTENQRPMKSVLLLLTSQEAAELIEKLQDLDHLTGEHIHVNDISFSREVTVAVYTSSNRTYFSEKFRDLIEQDE